MLFYFRCHALPLSKEMNVSLLQKVAEMCDEYNGMQALSFVSREWLEKY
jgi:hypothetical protein